ncbi:citrate synthase family protein [Microvirga antarctica]|uniref:citrate synthase family protein n=1 Tax=Microvirga antarctica TaxID=2819233 RepID=UPI001FE6956F|nr:citrate synthase family protein [Microvirga antarctica]
MTAQEVMRRLRLKPQTLYAYVSRGRIEARADDADPRKKLYRAADIGRLEYRKTRGRRGATIAEDAIAWGEPVLASSITTIAHGRLWYRGQDAEMLAQTARLEDIARLLWACGEARFPTQASIIPAGTGQQRMFALMAARAAADPVIAGRTPKALYLEAASVLDGLVDAVAGGPGEGPIHERIGRAWGCDADGAALIRIALVLLADHELNASTFAVRVTASTGASLAACVLAGLSALSGPLHGGMARRVRAFFDETQRDGTARAVRARLATGAPIPGFGHPLYPAGDPRARCLLAAFTLPAAFAEVSQTTQAITGEVSNIDFALTALSEILRLDDDGPFQIFAAARCTGWIAHALEQFQTGRLIRPRARYTGPAPDIT